MTDLKRRSVLAGAAAGVVALGATAAAKAAEFGNPDSPLQGSINSTPAAISEPGPQNPQLRDVLPSFNNPPPTDVGGMPIPWASFNEPTSVFRRVAGRAKSRRRRFRCRRTLRA
jgi:oxalate decarboxylase